MRAPQLLTSGSHSSFNTHDMLCVQIMKYQEIWMISWFQESYSTSWASLMAQGVKNLPAMQETWVWSLGWEDPREEGMATHANIRAWRIPGQRSLAGYSPWGHTESDTAQTAPVSWGSLYHAGHTDKISLTAKEVQIIDSYIFSKHCRQISTA